MKKFLKLSVTAAVAILSIASISSCKKNFDQPPTYVDPGIVANTSIKTLKALHSSGGYEAITTDMIVSGVVVANDKSGNFYKELYIQDATGAIALELDATNLYTSYPVGRRVFIKCKGLYLSDYGGMIQIGVIDRSTGVTSLAGIPSTLIGNYVFKGNSDNPVVPRVVTQSQLTTNIQDTLLGTLIQMNDYQFAVGDTSKTYADTSSAKNSINLNLKDCSGNTIILRSSGYANFAGLHPAGGKGPITAIYTIFNSTKQLIIRDTSDVQFNGPRCSLFEEDFSGIGANSATLSLAGWKNIGEVGGATYQNAVFGSGPTKCAKITAFSTGQATVTSWLITPAISLAGTTTPKLSFTTSAGFISASNPTLRVYISTTYNGSNTPSTFFTTQLAANIATPPASGFSSFLSSGSINLSAYAGQTVYIGFRYDGSDPTKTATYEVDDVSITRQ